MKTNIILSALAAIVLSASFNANASAAPVASETESSTYYVVNEYDSISAHDTDYWEVTLLAGKSYTIVVEGDGDTDLDLWLYDENDNEIDKDTDDTDYCICTVTPKWTGDFTIKIKNYGSVYNRYNIRIYR